ncbi:hypothetical protein CSC08_0031 [Escherichia coli]|nr:hypothetical protein CSC08_0031 [Escherichia coli]
MGAGGDDIIRLADCRERHRLDHQWLPMFLLRAYCGQD